ncbi:hypothetical protein [Streptomyces sp. 891-h]|uniref:hypothetical protein n=1 Tax=unclassified Streptomyces TaxID=2593676 RepID=UPI001FA98AE3|nr:hypothetical protein [Streptomyces sp. 891-h]
MNTIRRSLGLATTVLALTASLTATAVAAESAAPAQPSVADASAAKASPADVSRGRFSTRAACESAGQAGITAGDWESYRCSKRGRYTWVLLTNR